MPTTAAAKAIAMGTPRKAVAPIASANSPSGSQSFFGLCPSISARCASGTAPSSLMVSGRVEPSPCSSSTSPARRRTRPIRS